MGDGEGLDEQWQKPRPTVGDMVAKLLDGMDKYIEFQEETNKRLTNIEDYIEDQKKRQAREDRDRKKRNKLITLVVGAILASGYFIGDLIKKIANWIAA